MLNGQLKWLLFEWLIVDILRLEILKLLYLTVVMYHSVISLTYICPIRAYMAVKKYTHKNNKTKVVSFWK